MTILYSYNLYSDHQYYTLPQCIKTLLCTITSNLKL